MNLSENLLSSATLALNERVNPKLLRSEVLDDIEAVGVENAKRQLQGRIERAKYPYIQDYLQKLYQELEQTGTVDPEGWL